tara:strand:- start:775 stop:1146 length:372 start_codon:yes stop_codon:yes gene_type:complete
MAVTIMDDAAFSYRMIRDTSATTTVVQDVVSGPTTLYSVAIGNIACGHVTYLKLYDSLPDGGVVAGTTAPDLIFAATASAKNIYSIPGGFSFTTGMSYRCVREAGTAGTTNPASAVLLDFMVK